MIRSINIRMKTCSKCCIKKPESEFNWKQRSKNTRQSACKICSRTEGKKHYRTNKRRVVEAVSKRNATDRTLFTSWKETLECTLCGENDPACIDFHHTDTSAKDIEIGALSKGGQLKRTIKELRKCVILCSNCHRKHHAGRLPLANRHFLLSQEMVDKLQALVYPLASNQLKG